jgi:hypothetical protein
VAGSLSQNGTASHLLMSCRKHSVFFYDIAWWHVKLEWATTHPAAVIFRVVGKRDAFASNFTPPKSVPHFGLSSLLSATSTSLPKR